MTHAEYLRVWKRKNKESVKKSAKEYRHTHKECIKKYAKKYRDTHKKEIAIYMKEYRKKYFKEHPWAKTLMNIATRCGNKNHPNMTLLENHTISQLNISQHIVRAIQHT